MFRGLSYFILVASDIVLASPALRCYDKTENLSKVARN